MRLLTFSPLALVPVPGTAVTFRRASSVAVEASSFVKVQKKRQPFMSIFRFVMVRVVSLSPVTVESGKVSRKVFRSTLRPLGDTAVHSSVVHLSAWVTNTALSPA